MDNADDLIFQSSLDALYIRYSSIIGWQFINATKEQTRPHRNEKIAKNGGTENTGKIEVTTSIQLITDNGPISLDPGLSIEWLEFIAEAVQPIIWKAKKPGKPKTIIVDQSSGKTQDQRCGSA